MKRLLTAIFASLVLLCPLFAQTPVDVALVVADTERPEASGQGQLLSVTFGDYILYTFLLDRDTTEAARLSLLQAASVQEHQLSLPFLKGEPGLIDFHFHFSAADSSCTVRCGRDSCRFERVFLSQRNLQFNPLPDGREDLRLISLDVRRDTKQRTSWPVLALIIGILLGDLALFVYLYTRRKKQKATASAEPVAISSRRYVNSERNAETGIYLFGGFRVIAAEGADITSQFSPILRELLLLLICHTPKGGISSEQIKNILWYDKDEKSAINNRSVSLFKLRGLLRDVGTCEIRSEQGRWSLEAPSELVDYYRFIDLVKAGELTRTQIEALLTLVEYGPLLEGFNELWADPLKADVTDSILSVLTHFALGLDLRSQADLVLDSCDAINKFDPLNETAVALKCKAYREKGNSTLARQVFANFQKEYQAVYGEPFPREYSEIIAP